MKEILLKFLEGLGFDEEVISAIRAGDEKKIAELKADELVKEAIDRQKELLASDEDFTSPIRTEAIIGTLKHRENDVLKIFKSFISKEEFEKLPKDKRLEESFKLIERKVSAAIAEKSAGGDDASKKALKELQDKIDELQTENQKISEEKESEVTRIRQEADGKVSEYERKRVLMAEYQKTLGGKLLVDDEDQADLIFRKIEKQYDLKVEDGKPVLYEKGKATKATKNSKPIVFESMLTEVADPYLRKQDTPEKKKAYAEKKEEDEEGRPKVYRPGADLVKKAIEKREAEASGK